MTGPAATHVVLLTPEGRGAVASLLVAGPAAASVVGRLFHPRSGALWIEQPVGSLTLGRWQSPTVGEEVVVARRAEQQVEINCHGGAAAYTAIVESLRRHGCERIDRRQWVRQSIADPIAAEAEIALAGAPTDRTATILWDQRTGALRHALDEIAAKLSAGDLAGARRCVDKLLAWAPLGRHLVEPWRVVLAGRPNVGKSSLINALVGFERAIVHGTPGTTRDVVTALTAFDGWPAELSDTAGLRASSDPIEMAGIALAERHLVDADLVVLVLDASELPTRADAHLQAAWPEALVVLNKCDLVAPGERPAVSEGRYVSALTGAGIAALADEIAARLVPCVPVAGQAVPFLPSHVDCLEKMARALDDGRVDLAAEVLACAIPGAGQGASVLGLP